MIRQYFHGSTIASIVTFSAIIPAGIVRAQIPTIDTGERHVFSANAGWIDFRPTDTSGVTTADTILSGHAYAANFGWIDFGGGSPINGHRYSNAGGDFGVNLEPDGSLEGFAYGANVGWIRFERTHGDPRVDLMTGDFLGYAWSANLGWISLEGLATTTLSIKDDDDDGIGDAYEMLHFHSLAPASALTDSDGDGQNDAAEFLAGTDPLDANSQLRITSFIRPTESDPVATLGFTSPAGRILSIEFDDDLAPPWTDSPLGGFTGDGVSETFRSFPLAPANQRFFRIRARLPLQP